MKRTAKILLVSIAVAVLIAALAVTFAACNNKTTHRHAYTLVEAKSPSCTEDGNVQYYTCTCGKYFDSEKREIEKSQTVIPATGHDKVTTSWESDANSHWHKCNNCNEKFDLVSHTPSEEWVEDGEATCKAKAHRHKECPVCHYHIEEEDYGELAPHTWNSQTGKCDVCGATKPIYEERDGKIYFGEYPQTRETDNGITATLAQMSGARPVKGNSGKWTDYGYYISGEVDEYMWYIDLEYSGARYRGVYFTSYRPSWTLDNSSTSKSRQDDNGYEINTLYWFKWEPIEWRVLEKKGGEAFLMSNLIIDSHQFYHNGVDRDSVHPNNYKESDIRAWLSETFLAQAFDQAAQNIILNTLVDNSAEVSAAGADNTWACENTNDKVFLLSYADVKNPAYGFSSDDESDEARRLKPTDYALAQGLSPLNGYGTWWLRTPSYSEFQSTQAFRADVANTAGEIGGVNGITVVQSDFGVVPALKITL